MTPAAPAIAPPVTFTDLRAAQPRVYRNTSGFRELDRVLGGGFVPGTVVLVAGAPGAGKSTLLLEVAALRSCAGVGVAYVTAEEAVEQVQRRAVRLGMAVAPVSLAATEICRPCSPPSIATADRNSS